MTTFRQALASDMTLFFDGGLGTMLQARGLPAGMSPELFSMERPDVLMGIHADYIKAGTNILTTNTFGGTSFKLEGGLDCFDFNRRMAEIARSAAREAGQPVFVAGSLGPTGKFLQPLGDLTFREMVEAFRLQIRGLMAGGADLIIAETQFDIAEARAAVVAARLEGDIPVGVSMTFENGVSLTGTSPEVFAATMTNMGVDFIGTNCSAGPAEMAEMVDRLLAATHLPILAEPNAGLPELDGETTVFRLGAEPFAELTAPFLASGARMLGGCCGTTPDHIRALCQRARAGKRPQGGFPAGMVALTSRSSLVTLGGDSPFRIIGERINPTGKKQLSAELAAGEFTTALRFADEQVAAGADILDINVGAPMVDETELLPRLAAQVFSRHSLPLSLDSPNADAVERALSAYPASPLINSISGEAGHMARLGPVCRDFGAPFILLPLEGGKLPETAAERIAVLERLLAEMESLRIPRRLAVVDVLVLTVSSNAMAARECLDVIRHCRESLRLPTVAGLSNISFGLPARELVNAAFLSMGIGAGLSGCIANPGSARIREAVASGNLLSGKDPAAERFIAGYSGWKSGEATVVAAAGKADDAARTLENAVIKGWRDEVAAMVREELDKGADPFSLVSEKLIPAIGEVGKRYEKREYFLPQLIRSAETMQMAFAVLKPLLEKDSRSAEKPVMVIATVEGDIHDIGKNIVSLMLGNHGFEVVDLGKDVSAQRIVDEAVCRRARIIGLSALMTTTMVRMKDTVDLLTQKGITIPVMVGGAVVTPAFAESIGAVYSEDAVDAVRVAGELIALQNGRSAV